jgi:hypothetical protein
MRRVLTWITAVVVLTAGSAAIDLGVTAPEAAASNAPGGCTNWTDKVHPPPTINILRTDSKAMPVRVERIAFDAYVAAVLSDEWWHYPDFRNMDSLMAGAVAIKMFAWYHTMKGVTYKNGIGPGGVCFDLVDQGDKTLCNDGKFHSSTHRCSDYGGTYYQAAQRYSGTKLFSDSLFAMSATWPVVMWRDGKLFEPLYANNHWPCLKPIVAGKMDQEGADECDIVYGWNWSTILTWYYGAITLFDPSVTPPNPPKPSSVSAGANHVSLNTGGTAITITGQGLADATVSLGAEAGQIAVPNVTHVSDAQLRFVTPDVSGRTSLAAAATTRAATTLAAGGCGLTGTFAIWVTNQFGSERAGSVTYHQPPECHPAGPIDVAPREGPAATLITVTAKNIQHASRIYIGKCDSGVGCVIISRDKMRLSADGRSMVFNAPPPEPGMIGTWQRVSVAGRGGYNVPEPNDTYRYTHRPTIRKLVTRTGSACGGNVVRIRGRWLRPGVSVSFGEAPALAVTRHSGQVLDAVAPPHAAGKVHVTVQTEWGTSPTAPKTAYTYASCAPGP